MLYPTKKLSEICNLYQPKTISKSEMNDDGKYVVFGANGIIGKYDQFNHKDEEILITCRGATCGSINISEKFSWINGNAMVSHIKDKNILDFYYLYYFFKNTNFSKVITGSAQPQITRGGLTDLEIKLPPLKTQTQIVQKLDSSFEKIDKSIKKIKEDLENLEELNKSSLNSFGNFEKVLIGDIVEKLFAGGDLPKDKSFSKEETEDYKIPIYANAIKKDGLYGYTHTAKVFEDCITISARGTIGFTKIRTIPFYPIVRLLVLIPKKEIADIKYLEYVINTINLKQFGSSIPQLSVPQLKNFKIPLPPLKTQKQIVQKLDKIFEKNNFLKENFLEKLKNLEEMKKSLLKEAFEGRLV